MRHRRSAATNRKLAAQDARRLAAQARATHDPVLYHLARIARADAQMPEPLRAVLSGPKPTRAPTRVPVDPRDTAPLAYGDRPFSLFK